MHANCHLRSGLRLLQTNPGMIHLIQDIDGRCFNGGYAAYDSTAVEAEFINKTVGHILPDGKVTTRKEIDQAVQAVALQFGL